MVIDCRVWRFQSKIGNPKPQILPAPSPLAELQPAAFKALDEQYEAALNMITAQETKKAFDIASEDEKLREAYGKNEFGQNCLLARRLIEAGVRFVTVTDGGWDTHQNNSKSLKDSRIPPSIKRCRSC